MMSAEAVKFLGRRPFQARELVARAVRRYQVARVIPTASPFMRIPVVTDDCSVSWTDEGDQITPSDMSPTKSTRCPRSWPA